MATAGSYRRFLNVLMLGVGVLAVLGFASNGLRRIVSAPQSEGAFVSRSTAATPAGAEQGTLERRLQQLEVARTDLAERERRLAEAEASMKQRLTGRFLHMQVGASVLTFAVTLLLVSVLIRRSPEWSGLQRQLREEASRLRSLQLSVIGALEEFEATINAVGRSPSAASSKDAQPKESAYKAGAEVPAGGERAEYEEGSRITRSVPGTEEQPIKRGRPPAERPAAPARPAMDVAGPVRQETLGEMTSRGEGFFDEASDVMDQRSAAPARNTVRDGSFFPERHPSSWAERLTEKESAMEEQRRGPWSDSLRRKGTPPPARRPAVPDWRAQAEYLASEGVGESEIARRLGVSRQQVRLALSVGRVPRTRTRESA